MIITGWLKYELINEWTKEQTIKKLIDTFISLFAYSFYRFISKAKLILKYRMFMQKKNIKLESSCNSIVDNNIDWIM